MFTFSFYWVNHRSQFTFIVIFFNENTEILSSSAKISSTVSLLFPASAASTLTILLQCPLTGNLPISYLCNIIPSVAITLSVYSLTLVLHAVKLRPETKLWRVLRYWVLYEPEAWANLICNTTPSHHHLLYARKNNKSQIFLELNANFVFIISSHTFTPTAPITNTKGHPVPRNFTSFASNFQFQTTEQ